MAGGNVPANLAPVFQAAGKAANIPASVLAGIASVESNLGANTGPSSTGARGLMQFEPGTAASLGVNVGSAVSEIYGAAKLLNQYGYQQNPSRAIGAYNGGPGNPQYGYAAQVLAEAKRLAPQIAGGGGAPALQPGGRSVQVPGTANIQVPVQQQVFDQAGFDAARAKYIAGTAVKALSGSGNPYSTTVGASKGFASSLGSDSGALFSPGLLTTGAPDPNQFVSTKTTNESLQVATSQLQQIAGQSLMNVHAGAKGDVNPIPGAVIGRTDMGVDANLKPGAPILAPNDAKVVAIVPNWYSGQPYVAVQLLNGQNKGKVMYVAEQISGVPPVGSVIRKGQAITRYANSGTGIEIGWANPSNPTQTLAQGQGNTGGPGHSNSPSGANFRAYLGSFG